MRHGRFFFSLFLVAGLVLGPCQLAAQLDHDGDDQGQGHEMNEEMAAWMALAEPSTEHEFLERLVGTWNAKNRFWMEPDAPPIESTGVSTNEMILGGRFLESEYSGSMMGQPFHGFALEGYDVYQEKHTGLWIDSMGTLTMISEGNCDKSGKVLTMIAETRDPMTGLTMKTKGVTTFRSEDEYTYEMWYVGDGEPVKTMEVTYTRI